MPAEHDHDCARSALRIDNRGDDAPEVFRNQDVGKCLEKGAEGAIGAWRMREFPCAHLVGASGDGNRANAREIGVAAA
jgi:hypothetical protein